MEVHHINGDNTNNEISNLTYLCPNCHALTSTFRGKKNTIVKKKREISEEEFVKALQTSSSIRQALIQLDLNPQGENYTRVNRLVEKYNITFK